MTKGTKNQKNWRSMDMDLNWTREKYPELEVWRDLASKWVKSDKLNTRNRLMALSIFLESYLAKRSLPLDVKVFLSPDTDLPDFYEVACTKSAAGADRNNTINSFIEFILRTKFSRPGKNGQVEIDPAYRNPIEYRNIRTQQPDIKRTLGLTRKSDLNMRWISTKYPQLEEWRIEAVAWLKGEPRGLSDKIQAIGSFLERFIVKQSLPLDMAVFFSPKTLLPRFFETVCRNSSGGVRHTNYVHDFLDFVLKRKFSVEGDLGDLVVSGAFRNPVPYLGYSGVPKLDESVHSPLPYAYIDNLRQILAGGPNFSDWTWAQSALGTEVGKAGMPAPDWFPVTEAEIDRNDPDCVVRVRERTPWAGGDILEMWSPVRWVALLVKLMVPLRTFQVRVLDSGEADTWRWDEGSWSLNTGRLATGREGHPHQQGVFRRWKSPNGTMGTQLYINTNKTADIAKSGPHLGFTVPWPHTPGPSHRDVYYWLEKLRNWQEKYNPLTHRTPWTELDPRHMVAKSEIQLAAYPDACFLFRQAEAKRKEERFYPVADSAVSRAWCELLITLEDRFAEQGRTHADGGRIRFIQSGQDGQRGRASTTYFPLHSLRVSMVTALALDGQVPFPILAKAVGHSRLIMTLYYTKPGAGHIADALADGVARLEMNKEKSALTFLRDTEHAHLVKSAICNSTTTLSSAIPQNPADRNPAGWQDMGHGICLVGGNISELEENKRIGGCFNGGPVAHATNNRYAPVPGGPRNCIRCRWFVTMPHYLPALAVRFNNLSWHVDEAMADAVRREEAYYKLKDEQSDAATEGQPFCRTNELAQAERLRETALGKWSDLAENLVACWRLIERCLDAMKDPGEGMKLVSVGTAMDVQAKFEETGSELLQLAGVCEDLELYPDLEPGKAILRRSQLLDAALANEGQAPMLLRFSEPEQLLIGNAVVRQLGKAMNPSEPEIGKRQVIAMMEAGEKIGDCLGVDLIEILAGSTDKSILVRTNSNGGRHVLFDRSSS